MFVQISPLRAPEYETSFTQRIYLILSLHIILLREESADIIFRIILMG